MLSRNLRKACAAVGAAALVLGGLSLVGPATAAYAAQPGDLSRFDTWIGYDVGQYPSVAAMGDFDGDGRLDVAWGLDSWSPNHMSVSLNIGDGTLAPATAYAAGNETTDLAVADLDGDHDLDIVGAGQGSYVDGNDVDIYLNDGAGKFEHSSLEAGDHPTNLALADLDDDGDTDIVMANSGTYDPDNPDDGGIGVLVNNGDATFAAEARYHVGPGTYEVVLADFDSDDVLDAAATNYDFDADQPHQLSVLRGNGDGTFSPDANPQVLSGAVVGYAGQAAMDAGDLDDDGTVDLALGGTSSQTDAVLLNDGSGEFAVTTYDVFGAVSIRVVDADDDGDVDVLSVGGGGGVAGQFHVQRNTGDGTLAAVENGITSNNPLGLAVGDLDGDGRVDLATANRDTATGAVHRQRSDGTFAAPPAGSQFAPATEIATADVDGDGDLDVAATSQDGSNDVIRIYKNDGSGGLSDAGFVRWDDTLSRQTTTVRLADLDGDSDQDLTWIVNQYSYQRVVQALNNGNGTYATPTARSIATCTDEMQIADVDGDGDLDEVFGNENTCGATQAEYFDIAVSYNNGAATFGNDIRVRMSWANRAIAVFDVDSDGYNDIVSGGQENYFEGEPTGDISVAYGDGTGAFARGAYQFTATTHREFAVIDFEGDGDLDIASASYYEGTSVLTNDGSGTFTDTELPDQYIHGYGNTAGIAAGDVDGDAIPDIVIAHVTGSDVGIHTGFGDGTFQGQQVRYGLRPRVSDVALADLNGDGLLDIVSPATIGGFADGEADAGAAAAAPGVLVLKNRRPACTIQGTAGPDALRGTKKTDVICGGGGDDVIKGRGGGDILRGGQGNDNLAGGTGLDVLDGEQGNDKLAGNDQDDKLRGSSGNDTLRGGTGRDVLDLLDGTSGNDTGSGGVGVNHCRGDKKDKLSNCA